MESLAPQIAPQSCSAEGRRLIEAFENCRLKAYPDQNDVWTIGYGHTRHVKEGDTCTFAQADQWMDEDLMDAESAINKLVPKSVPLSQPQFDALVCLVFNIGEPQFETSTVLKRLKAKLYTEAADAFLLWVKTKGMVNKGLVRRRTEERALFLKGLAA